MSFNKIKNIIGKISKFTIFFVIISILFIPELGFATENAEEGALLTIIHFFISSVGIILATLTSFAGWFLTPEWTSGSAIGFGEKLRTLWILISNVVYTIFALILIFIAFMNIIGKGENTWELKQAIPKFIVGVLIVPFSWFIVSVFIGISSILTVSVLTIPSSHFQETYKGFDKLGFCKKFEYNFSSSDKKSSSKSPINCLEDISFGEFLSESDSVFSIMSFYTYGVMKIDKNGKLFAKDAEKIGSLSELTATVVISLLFFIVFFLLMIALVLALFVRGICIWLFTIMSPFFGLLYFFGDKTPDTLKKFTFSKFIGLVMMPVYVAAALSFGMLFISTAGESLEKNSTKCNEQTTSSGEKFCIGEINDDGDSYIRFLGTEHIFRGVFSNSSDKVKQSLKGFHTSIGSMILQIFGLVIMWIAIMAALKSSELTKEIIKPIESFGNSVGQVAMKAPTYAPIIPSPSGGTMSSAGLQSFGSAAQSSINRTFTDKGANLASDIFDPSPIVRKLDELKRSYNDSMTNQQIGSNIKSAMELMTEESMKNNNEVSKLKEVLITYGLDEKSIGNIKVNTTPETISGILDKAIKGSKISYADMGLTSKDDIRKIFSYNNTSSDTNQDNSKSSSGSNTDNTFNITMPNKLTKDKVFTDGDYNKGVGGDDFDKIKNSIKNIGNVTLKEFKSELNKGLTSKGITDPKEQDVIYSALEGSLGTKNFKKEENN